MQMEPAERICFNCVSFFPSSTDEETEYGFCLEDPVFEPFLDQILEHDDLDCCRDLVKKRKFLGERYACDKFEESFHIEYQPDSPLGQDLTRLKEAGELTAENIRAVMFRHGALELDMRKVPIDNHVKDLQSSDYHTQKEAIRNLGGLIAQGNEKAFDALLAYFKELTPPKSVDDVHLKMEILRSLTWRNNQHDLIPIMVEELYRTESNNTTRQWISEIFRFFERCNLEDVEEPLEKMLEDKRFSYRLKKKMRSILEEDDFW